MKENAKDRIKKQSVIRNWFQAAWFVLSNSYLRGYKKGMIFSGNTKVICFPGLNCYSCPGALGACPMGSLQAVMGDSGFRVSLYVFGMLAAMGALFGRLICGWMCPFGLFQDLLYRIPVRIKKKNLPGHQYLKYLKYVILIIFPILLVSIVTDLTGTSAPWFCEWICPSGMLLGGIPLVTANAGLRAAAGARFAWKLFVLIAITVLSIFYYRPFCKYLCPLGAIYSLFNPIASYRLVIDKEKCVSCGACQKACGMDIRTFETPNSMECIRCGSCIKACPAGAISSTWGQTAERIKSRCFVDDETEVSVPAPGSNGVSESLTKKTLFYGIMTIITGLPAVLGIMFLGVYGNMQSRMTIDFYQSMNCLYIVTFLLWTIATVLLLLTGVFAVRYRKDPETIKSLAEKVKAALFFEIAGFLVSIAGIAMDMGTVMSYVNPAIYALPFFLGVPIAACMGSVLRRSACIGTGGEVSGKGTGRNIFWIILSVLYVLNLCAFVAVLAALQSLA